jgi:hypothetical protein
MLNGNNIIDLPAESWKPVRGYEQLYWVSNKGRVKNSRKLMKFYRISSGYLCIDFTSNKVKKKFLVHRLVAANFLDNTEEYPEVNHIDENKDNNTTSNLEWCSCSHNTQHSIASGTYDKIYTTRNTLGKKHLPNTSSKYHNVSYDKNRDKWVAQIRHQGKNCGMKRFNTEIEAALHVNTVIDEIGLIDRPKNIID